MVDNGVYIWFIMVYNGVHVIVNVHHWKNTSLGGNITKKIGESKSWDNFGILPGIIKKLKNLNANTVGD